MSVILIHSYTNFKNLNDIPHEVKSLLPTYFQLPKDCIWQFPNYQQKTTIDLIRQLQYQFIKKTGTKTYVYFFQNLHLTSNIIQNSLLKILEEPPKNTYFILHTQNLTILLDTLKSRCQIISSPNQVSHFSYLDYLIFDSWVSLNPSQLATLLQQKINHLSQTTENNDTTTLLSSIFNQILLELDQLYLQKTLSLPTHQTFLLKKLITQAQTYLLTNLNSKSIIANFAYQYYRQNHSAITT